MKQELQSTDSYLIDSDVEMLRLDRQAAIYGNSDDLAHLALGPTDRVLDAGCGSESESFSPRAGTRLASIQA